MSQEENVATLVGVTSSEGSSSVNGLSISPIATDVF